MSKEKWLWLSGGIVAAIVLIAVFCLLARRDKEKAPGEGERPAPRGMPIRTLVAGAMCVAVAFVLSYIKLFSMPMGGSVTLCSMLPIFLFADRFGLKNGLLAGLAYGLLQFIQKPEIYHWAQVILDYPLAFTALGLAGVFALSKNSAFRAWSLPAGCVVGGAGRLLCSVISGAVFFGAYAPEGMNAWLYSFLYNGAYLGVDTALCVLLSVPVCAILKKNRIWAPDVR